MKKNITTGKKEELHNERLIQDIKLHFFSDETSYSESELKNAVRIITDKIQGYATAHPKDTKVLELVKNKLLDSGNTGEIFNTRTLKRSLQGEGTSVSTINVFKAFFLVLEKEEEKKQRDELILERVEGLYYVFAVHHSEAGKFQESLVKISRDGVGSVKFLNRDFKIEQNLLRTEHLGNNNLLLAMEDGDFPLVFYVYMGPGREKHPFYQAAYIYSNGKGNTVANLTVFQRVGESEYENEEAFIEGYSPKREQKMLTDDISDKVESDTNLTVRRNIQYFLHSIRPIATVLHQDRIPFNFRKSVHEYPGSYFRPAKFYGRKFIGNYHAYFHERFSSSKSEDGAFEKNDFFSTVGKGFLRLWQDEVTGVLNCEFNTNKSEKAGDVLTYQGVVVNDQLNSSDYLILSMYLKPHDDRYINVLLRVIDDNKLIGNFNIAYSPPGQLGSGSTVFVRVSEREEAKSEKGKPETLNPTVGNLKSLIEHRIVNYLSHKQQSLVTPPSYESLESYNDLLYRGVYFLYGIRPKEGILKNVMVIYRNGAVRLIQAEKRHASGEAEHDGNALNIHLRYDKKHNSCYFCVRVDGVQPRENSFYLGNFAGISLDGDEKPYATPVVFEFIGLDKETYTEEQLFELVDIYKVPRPGVPEVVKSYLSKKKSSNIDKNIFCRDDFEFIKGVES